MSFVSEHGGRVFVWADADGLEHTRLEAPDHPVDFESIPVGEIELNVDRTIAPPPYWTLVLHHLPEKHVEAVWGRRPNAPWLSSVPPAGGSGVGLSGRRARRRARPPPRRAAAASP